MKKPAIAWTYARDRRVGAWARANGVAWQEMPQCAVVRRLRSRDGWQCARTAFISAGRSCYTRSLGACLHARPAHRLPEAQRGLGWRRTPAAHRQRGEPCCGAACDTSTVFSDLAGRRVIARPPMSSPLTGRAGVVHVCHPIWRWAFCRCAKWNLRGKRPLWSVPAGSASMTSFAKRLAWRDHFIQKLEDEPALEHRCLHRAHEGLRGTDAARLAAWADGQTGVAFCRCVYALPDGHGLAEFPGCAPC